MYATLLLVLLSPLGWQESAEVTEYRQQHAHYTDVLDLADPADRAKQFMDFVEEGFQEQLTGAVQAGINDSLDELSGTGQFDLLYPLADRWDAQTGELNGAVFSLTAAAGSENNEMIIKYGETIYAAQPIIDIAQLLAVSYTTLGNNAKYLEYANIVINEKGVADAFDFSYNIYQQEYRAEDWDGAAGWAQRLAGLGSAPGGVAASEWQEMGKDFQTTVARAHYEGGRHREAVREFDTLQDMDRGLRGMANFYMGRSYLELQEFNLAMQRFADASLVNDDTFSGPARAMLEEIYRTNTGGTLLNIEDNVLRAARARMR